MYQLLRKYSQMVRRFWGWSQLWNVCGKQTDLFTFKQTWPYVATLHPVCQCALEFHIGGVVLFRIIINVFHCQGHGVSVSCSDPCQWVWGEHLAKHFYEHNRSSCKAFGKSMTTIAHFSKACLGWQRGVSSEARLFSACKLVQCQQWQQPADHCLMNPLFTEISPLP